MSSFRLRPWVFLAGIALFAIGGLAAADPPSRAARLGYMSGSISFSPAGEDAWVQATQNRPLTTGDRLWVDADSRAEVQVGGAALRMGASTSVTLLNLDDSIAQVQLTQGTLKVRVRRLAPNQVFEVDTPNLAFTLRRPGEYRIEVDPAGNATAVMVQSGQGEVYGDGASYVVDSRQGYRFAGTGLMDYQLIDARRDDEFDRWASERDRRSDSSASARYVSSDVVGYEDLDGNGTWRRDPGYGNIWVPNHMVAGWTPYQTGHWAWVDPWGWSWVDDAPWGFAVSHYGRWANMSGTWGWVPGPVSARAVYAPALVAFIGGGSFLASISLGGGGAIGWFPLAPRDVYRPSYAASRGYFNNINRSNTAINNTTITNVYNTTNVTKIVYANRQVPGAVVAVPTTTFVHARPVAKEAVRVSKEALAGGQVSTVAAVAPVQQSVHGAAAPGAKPPARDHGIVARSAPPPPPVGLAAQQTQLAARPGRPIEDAARRQLKPVAPVPAAKVSVVATGQAKPPVAAPPAARARDGGGRPDQGRAGAVPSRREPAAPQQSPVSPETARSPVTPSATGRPSAADSQTPQPASRPGRRDESARPVPPVRTERSPAVSPPAVSPPAAGPVTPAAAVPPAAIAPPPAPTAPPVIAQPPQQAVRPAQRDEAVRPSATPRSDRSQAVSPPVVSPPPAAPTSAPPAAVAQPPQQAARPAQREEAARPAMPPRAERPPAAAPPAALATPPQQRARPEPAAPVTPRAAPPVVLPPQVRPPPIVAPPPIAPTPAPAPAPQRARPEPRVQPVVPAPAPQAVPAPVRPPAPAAPAAAPPPAPKPAAQQPAPKPAPDAGKAVERKKPGEENPK
jgi:hypothetical protein